MAAFDFLVLQRRLAALKHAAYTRLLRRSFGAMGRGCLVQATLRCTNPRDIYLGDRVFVGADAWIDCFTDHFGQRFSPRLEIGDDTMIGYHGHIMCVGHLRIGRDVLIADKVYISDNLHGFADIARPILPQPLVHHRPVTIEDQVWIGENACVLPGVTLGRHSVIGANSVVTKDVPPYAVAAGVPARVIRQYDPATKQWARAETNGKAERVEPHLGQGAMDLARIVGRDEAT